jgi:SAM-dependent methyltransferase
MHRTSFRSATLYSLRDTAGKIKRALFRSPAGLALFKLRYIGKERFTCPICMYSGPFVDINPETGPRKHATCPRCDSAERHRLQYLVIEEIGRKKDLSGMSILHFAPEPFFRKLFQEKFDSYTSADLNMKDVDYRADLLDLPFEDGSYDFVFASHVLEHIKEDDRALHEISRVLKPGGIAVIHVPVFGAETVEYPEPNPDEGYHVRAPGIDYYDRYSTYFSKIEKYDSGSFSEKYQLFIYEDRGKWPETITLRPAAEGERHIDIIPVCYK